MAGKKVAEEEERQVGEEERQAGEAKEVQVLEVLAGNRSGSCPYWWC